MTNFGVQHTFSHGNIPLYAYVLKNGAFSHFELPHRQLCTRIVQRYKYKDMQTLQKRIQSDTSNCQGWKMWSPAAAK